MAKKTAKKKVEKVVESPVVPTKIELLSIDYGREDLNTMGRKINEIITFIHEGAK